MTNRGQRGLTLVELLMTITIISIIAAASAALLDICLRSQSYATKRTGLRREATQVMERITAGVRSSTFVMIPNNHAPTRTILAFSGTVNDDNDYYFGDALFPKIDEDPPDDMNNDNKSGIANVDDNGNGGLIDPVLEALNKFDDDEDGFSNEDPLNGIDDDGDGNIDEDVDNDANADEAPGLSGFDDDGDGTVDEGNDDDDDEDGVRDEDPLNEVIYERSGNQLTEATKGSAAVVLTTRATAFSVTYEPPTGGHDPRLLITLTLTDSSTGEVVQLTEYSYPRNILQRTGKRVL